MMTCPALIGSITIVAFLSSLMVMFRRGLTIPTLSTLKVTVTSPIEESRDGFTRKSVMLKVSERRISTSCSDTCRETWDGDSTDIQEPVCSRINSSRVVYILCEGFTTSTT